MVEARRFMDLERPRRMPTKKQSCLPVIPHHNLGKVLLSDSQDVMDLLAEIDRQTVHRCRIYLEKVQQLWSD